MAGSEKVSVHDRNKGMRESSVGGNKNIMSKSNNQNSVSLLKDRINESKHINKSLFFLTQVISLRSQGNL